MTDWLRIRKEPIEAVEHGLSQVPQLSATYVGPRTWDNIEYPIAEVLPQSTNYAGGNDFTHQIFANLYFERGRDTDYIEDVLHPVADALDECLASLSNTQETTEYRPESIEDYAGELDNSLVLLVSIRFHIRTAVDLADI